MTPLLRHDDVTPVCMRRSEIIPAWPFKQPNRPNPKGRSGEGGRTCDKRDEGGLDAGGKSAFICRLICSTYLSDIFLQFAVLFCCLVGNIS